MRRAMCAWMCVHPHELAVAYSLRQHFPTISQMLTQTSAYSLTHTMKYMFTSLRSTNIWCHKPRAGAQPPVELTLLQPTSGVNITIHIPVHVTQVVQYSSCLPVQCVECFNKVVVQPICPMQVGGPEVNQFRKTEALCRNIVLMREK